MTRAVGLAVALFLFWLLLSGHGEAFLVVAGALSAALLAALAGRIGTADEEGFPVDRLPAGLLYWPWLLKEIVKSSLEVARIILSPSLPISPRLIAVKRGPRTAVGVVTYANSITLTPGTITVDIDRHDRRLLVHALTAEGAAGVASGDMDRRVTAFEGRR